MASHKCSVLYNFLFPEDVPLDFNLILNTIFLVDILAKVLLVLFYENKNY